jgi:L-fuculose-phosphate aldolase
MLLANHGAVVCGTSLFDAFCKMETLEHVAQIRLATWQLGTWNTLEADQERLLRRARERYMQNV